MKKWFFMCLFSGLGLTLSAQEGLAFHSRLEEFRSPLGALELGKTLNLQVVLGPSETQEVTLMVQKETQEEKIPCTQASLGNQKTAWKASWKPRTPGVWSYWFLVKGPRGLLALGNNSSKLDLGNGVVLVGTGGPGVLTEEKSRVPFRLTVYQKGLKAQGDPGVWYYLIPDRFKNGDPKNDPIPGQAWFYQGKTIEKHSEWADGGPWVPGKMKDGHKEDDDLFNNDFYGGDLAGVLQKLDYLQALGVTQVSLTPVFDGPSNHKYEPRDLSKIDAALGTWDTWKALVQAAGNLKIGILPMMVYSHISSDSPQFDRFQRHGAQGAFAGEIIQKNSPYFDWFTFTPQGAQPKDQYLWKWAEEFVQLTEAPGVQKYLFQGPNSITFQWLNQGASGVRVDVAAHRSAAFWQAWREEILKNKPGILSLADHRGTLGDLWSTGAFNASTNYVFRKSALDFALGGPAENFQAAWDMVVEETPAELIPGLMNILSADDTPRALFELGYKQPSDNLSLAQNRYKLLTALQYFLPGRPGVFYGDELGLAGGKDPLHRRTMPWKEDLGHGGSPDILGLHQTLGKLRKARPQVFSSGALKFLQASGDTLILERRVPGAPGLLGIFYSGNSSKTLKLAGLGAGWKNLLTQKPEDPALGLNLEPLGWVWLQGPVAP